MTLKFDFSHEGARSAIILTVAALTPFVLRTLGDWLVSLILENCCKMTKKELGAHLIGKGSSKVTIAAIFVKDLDWNAAREDLEINQRAAVFIGCIRLGFWHLMQPTLYAFVLYAYWDLLDNGQQILGTIVGVREAIYFLLCLLCCYANPTFLLVDLRATVREDEDGKMLALMYAMAPEKYVTLCLIRGENENAAIISSLCLSVLDVAGIVAFIWAIVVNRIFPAMLIGYTVTTLGGITFVAIMCYACCDECCRY